MIEKVSLHGRQEVRKYIGGIEMTKLGMYIQNYQRIKKRNTNSFLYVKYKLEEKEVKKKFN